MILLFAAVLFLDGVSNSPEIGAAFGKLSGGPSARILLIPTALPESALNDLNLKAMPQTGQKYFDVPTVEIVHARTREQAATDGFVEPLNTATAIFFMGGDHNRILDRYAGNRFERALKAFHQRGGTIGGSSAGVMVLGSYQAGRQNNAITDSPANRTGFALLPDTMIDVHFTERRRHSHIPPVLKKHRELRLIGIDERTAAIIRDGNIEVIGPGAVTIFEGKSMQVLRALK